MTALSHVSYALALVLAGLLAVAAAAKVRTPLATASTFRALGVPAPGPLARLVPAGELVVAALLVGAPRAGGAAAFVLLAAFSVVLARAWRAGVDVSCGCFGSTSTSTVSSVTLARNAVLAAGALVVATTADRVAPDVASVIVAGTASLLAAVGLALGELRRATGAVWKVDVP